jgi:mono/diheme cytochrome c family protein
MIWRFLTASCCLVVASTLSLGDNCVTATPVVQEAYVAPQVILVPAYFASYQPSPTPVDPPVGPVATPAPAPTPPSANDTQLILEELRKLNQKLDLILNGSPAPAAPAAKPAVDPNVAVVQRVLGASCIKCHGADVAEAKGGAFVIVGKDGKTPKFTPQELNRIRSRVSKAEMPPKSVTPLTAEEKAAMTAFFR